MFRTSEFLDISKKASVSDWSGHKRRSLTVARGDATCCVFDGWFLNFGGIANSGRPCDVVDAINLRKENTRFQVISDILSRPSQNRDLDKDTHFGLKKYTLLWNDINLFIETSPIAQSAGQCYIYNVRRYFLPNRRALRWRAKWRMSESQIYQKISHRHVQRRPSK